MAALVSPTIDAIWAAYEASAERRLPRRLGASEIGRECGRRLWLSFHHAQEPERHTGRMLRLFDTGHSQEARIVEDLRRAGLEVWDRAPDGEQWTYTALDGHFVAKLDGVVLGVKEAPQTPHDLSCKSANAKNWAKITKDGVEKAKPEHWAQMQAEMGLADLTRALYVVVNKDTDDLWVERVRFDPAAFRAIMQKAALIIRSESPPPRIAGSADKWPCKFCHFAPLCHSTAAPRVSCRTCVHAAPGPNGEWTCGRGLEMVADCDDHLFVPDLLDHWAEPVDGDPSWIRYRVKGERREFINVAASGFPAADVEHYSSNQLATTDPARIGLDGGEREAAASERAEAWRRSSWA